MHLCSLCKKLYPDDHTLCVDHASAALLDVSVEPLPAELAERFPRHEAFAQGRAGTLYKLADDASTLLKVLHVSLTRDATERARYRRELRRQQNLIQPQLPRVHEVGETEERVWFTRDFIEGHSLASRLQTGEAWELAAAYSVIVQLAAALDALHQLGLVHRDVKPGHVLLRAKRSPRESLQLIDAAVAGPLLPDDDYAARELIDGAPATFRSDLYALGCLSYQLLSGTPPFRDATANAAREREPEELPDNVPPAVRSLITSMLAKDAHRRPFSAQQVRRALEPHVAVANAAARSASLNAAQLQAAALRSRGPAAKPLVPATFPDATVELDVEDLDEAIQLNDEPEKDADTDDAPTIAVNTLSTRAIMSSMLPSKQPSAAGPTHAPTGTKFGLGPVRAEDIHAASALAAELKSSPLPAAAADDAKTTALNTGDILTTAAPLPKPVARSNGKRTRYTAVQHPLMQSPHVLLVAAAGLVALIVLLRVLLGPSETTRSAAVVVQVPEAESETAQIDALGQQAQQQLDQLSEDALIGGDIPRKPQLTAAQRRHAAQASQGDQVAQADASQLAAAEASLPAPQSVAPVPVAHVATDGPPADEAADAKNVPTVSAGSVRGGLARAASNRSAATSGNTNVSAVNAADSPDTDYKAKGRALFKAGKFTEAVEAYQRATKRDAADAAAFAGLGGSLLAKGETRRAITAYQKAVRLQPEVSGFQAALGRAYLQKGDHTRARAAYSKALTLDPNNQAARTGMANAKAR